MKYSVSRGVVFLLAALWCTEALAAPATGELKGTKLRNGEAAGVQLNLGEPEKKRFVIEGIEIGRGLQTEQRDLLLRIHEELPLDILNQLHLEYYDPSAPSDIRKWNPDESYRARKLEQIHKALADAKIRYNLILSLSLAPGGRDERRMLLSGRLIDLVTMQCLVSKGAVRTAARALAEGDAALVEAAGKNYACDTDRDLPDAVHNASVDLRDFNELRPSLRTLFARLFEFPEISVTHTTETEYELDQTVEVRYDLLAKRSAHGEQEWLGAPRNSAYALRGNLLELTGEPSSIIEEVCANPRLNLLRSYGKDSISRVGHARVSQHKVDESSMQTALHGYGTGTVRFTRSYAATYLLTTSVFRFIPQGSYTALSIPSEPAAVCIHVREPRLRLGYLLAGSIPRLGGEGRTGFGIDLFWAKPWPFRIINIDKLLFFPSIAVGPVLGIDYRPPQSTDTESNVERVQHWVALDARIRLSMTVLRVMGFDVSGFADFGAGAEWRGSSSATPDSSWHGYLTYGCGVKAPFPLVPWVQVSVWYKEYLRGDFLPGNTNLPEERQRIGSVWIGFGGEIFFRRARRREHP